MTQEEAIAKAKALADEHGWPWLLPVVAIRRRLLFVCGPATWHVRSNADSLGCNVNVHFNDKTGEVTTKGFEPR
jgi:hypothetical protein